MSESGSKRIIDVDWENYVETFPHRYLNKSQFDRRVRRELACPTRDGWDILDLGGGSFGSEVLDFDDGDDVYLLDPHVESHAIWVVDTFSWKQAEKRRFNLIVARGSFNYLSPLEISSIRGMLAPGGIFMCNTFFQARTTRRRYVFNNGEGEERAVLQDDGITVVHELEPDGEDFIIRHEFMHRPLGTIINLLGTEGLSFEFLGPNTVMITIRNPK